MSIGAWLGGIILATALVVQQADALHWAARLWTALLMVPFPALMILQAKALREVPALPRRAAYVSSIFALWLLALVTLIVALASGYDARELRLLPISIPRDLLLALFVTAAAIATQFAFRFAGVREAPVLRELLPVSAADRRLFVLVSISAGVCEELVFRGFLLRALTLATGMTGLAVLLSAGAFGVVHAYQSPAGALRAAILGLLLTLPLLLGASLLSAMLAHILIDVIAGIWLAKYLIAR